jgi:hypothetical protein
MNVSRVYLDGGLDAQALRSEVNIGNQALDAGPIINRSARHNSTEVHSQDPFSAVKFLFPLLGAAALAGELERRR